MSSILLICTCTLGLCLLFDELLYSACRMVTQLSLESFKMDIQQNLWRLSWNPVAASTLPIEIK